MKYDVENNIVKKSKSFLLKLETYGRYSHEELINHLNDLINDNIKDKHAIIDLQAKLGKQQRKERKS